MPTSRPRHSITETDDIAEALRDARQRWPRERSAAALLGRLITIGRDHIATHPSSEQIRRAQAVDEVAGSLTGVYPPRAGEQLRREWPR